MWFGNLSVLVTRELVSGERQLVVTLLRLFVTECSSAVPQCSRPVCAASQLPPCGEKSGYSALIQKDSTGHWR